MRGATYMLDTNEHISHQRWLIENGFINDLHKDNLYMYGSIVHVDVQAVEVRIDIEKKAVEYDLYLTKHLLNRIDRFNVLSKDNSIIGLWMFKRMLKKEGNMNFLSILSNFVK